MTHSDIRVLAAIGIHINWQTGEGCFASASTLAGEAGVTKRAFYRSAARLIAKGYTRKTIRRRPHGPNRSSVYDVLLDRLDDGWEIDDSPEPDTDDDVNDELSSDPAVTSDQALSPSSDQALSPITSLVNGNRSSSSSAWEFSTDFQELMDRVKAVGGSQPAWKAEINVARHGLHTPKLTDDEIGQAIRDFNASGADISLRLFRGYLRGNGSSAPENGSAGQLGAKNGRKKGYTLAAAELRDRLVKVSSILPGQGTRSLTVAWQQSFTEPEIRVIKAIGPSRILNDTNDGTLISQLAKAMEEAG